MYAGVPTQVPTRVSTERTPVGASSASATSGRASRIFAMPKSSTRTLSSVGAFGWRQSMTFSGLMSRCTTPCWCACSSAAQTSTMISTARDSVKEPLVFTRAERSSPKSSSIAM